MRKIALLAIAFTITLGCSTNKGEYFVYPGSGIAHISRDVEIRGLQEELKGCSLHHDNIYFNEGRFEFIDISDFTFTAPKKFSGKELWLEVDVRIYSGECWITFGKLKYIIGKRGIRVINDTETLYADNSSIVKTIFISKPIATPIQSTILLFLSDRYHYETIHTIIDMPAALQIELADNCSGYIGPWVWRRGME